LGIGDIGEPIFVATFNFKAGGEKKVGEKHE
jgi:hypothetical protein